MALGQYLPMEVQRDLIIQALMLKRLSSVILGFLGTPVEMITISDPSKFFPNYYSLAYPDTYLFFNNLFS